jgi:nucleoside-diphosphate-sugar epimerase
MNVLVTGGGGFLGTAIVKRLVDLNFDVRSFSRGKYPHLEKIGVPQFHGDLADSSAVQEACRDCQIIFHVAAKAGLWGRDEDFYNSNVIGTRNVLAACHGLGIRNLIYTSSPSVIFDGKDQDGIDETVDYPIEYKAAYPRTKAEAEKLVVNANSDRLRTVSLRPHLIWGPEDNHLTPGILAKGKTGRLRRLGNSNKLVDFTYIDNAAEAHILAGKSMLEGADIGGGVYFISQSEPWPLWDFVNRLMETAGYPPVGKTLPPGFAYHLGGALEWIFRTLRLPGDPPVTRFMVEELVTSHWYDNSAAERDFGYKPRISMKEGLKRLEKWIEQEGRKKWSL